VPKKSKSAIFLDRDGTILNERGYLGDPRQIHFYSFAFEALRKLRQAGYKLVVITNQSGIGRGYFSEATLKKVHQRFLALLKKKGVRIDGIYYCPHTPEAGCRCRKPKPYLVKQATKKMGLQLKTSYVIGDQARDIELAERAGARGVLVLTGAGRTTRRSKGKDAAYVATNLLSAAKWITEQKI